MRLISIHLLFFCYVLFSLIRPLPWRWQAKTAATLVVLALSLKFSLYKLLGGSFISPGLPTWLLLDIEILFNAYLLLVCLLVFKDILILLLWINRRLGSHWHLPWTPGIRGAGMITLALTLSLFGTWQALQVPEVRTVTLTLPRLPPALDGLSIVQLTDLHVGPLLKKRWLQQVVDRTNGIQPDLIVLTGDMIDGSPETLRQDVAPLGELKARYGIFGINGNHEYYSDAAKWLPVFRKLGIVMLENEKRTLSVRGKQLVLIGLTDPTALRFGEPGPDCTQLQQQRLPGIHILLQHRPPKTNQTCRADVQLSGHTHGGQLFFLKPLVAAFNHGYIRGLYQMGDMQLYVSPGTGLWSGFFCRIGVPAEITRILLRSPQKK